MEKTFSPIFIKISDDRSGVLSIWHISTQGDQGETRNLMLTLAIDLDGQRVPAWEKQADHIFQLPPANTNGETQLNLEHKLGGGQTPKIDVNCNCTISR